MAQRHLYEIIAAEAGKFIGIAVKRKRALNTFRQHTQDFIHSQDTVCVLLAGQHAAQPGDEGRYERKLQQTGMTQETRGPAGVPHDQVQGHNGVPGHETAMAACQDRATVKRNVLQSPGFNAPIVLAEEMEERFTAGLDKVPVHAELIQWGFLRGGGGAIHEKYRWTSH